MEGRGKGRGKKALGGKGGGRIRGVLSYLCGKLLGGCAVDVAGDGADLPLGVLEELADHGATLRAGCAEDGDRGHFLGGNWCCCCWCSE